MRTFLVALIATLALGTPAYGAGSEYVTPPTDTRPCAAPREVWQTNDGSLNRTGLERRWEVSGKGHVEYILGERSWLYPVCDDATRFGVAVFYKGHLVGVGMYTPGQLG